MKHSVAVLCLLLLCLGPITAPAGIEIDGFLGMRWGSTLSELQRTRQLLLTKEDDGSGGSLYALQGENLRFGQATLTGIHCSFVEQRLQGVILLFAGSGNYGAVKAEAEKRYGKPIKIDQNGGEMFSWPGERTSIVLSFTRNAESGFLFLKPKKQLQPAPEVGTISPRPGPSPPPDTTAKDHLDLFDQASQQPGIMVEPSLPPQPTALPSPPDPPRGDHGRGSLGSYPESATVGLINEEIQGLIDRDQALTSLCWDTVGPAADQACEEMKANARQLQQLGWCMKPGEAKDGLEVIWYRCDSGPAPAPHQPALPGSSAPPLPTAQEQSPKAVLCRLAGELFAAAADMRKQGVTPLAAEEALLQRQSGRSLQLGIEHIRETVELVYFDQEFSSKFGNALAIRVEGLCLAGEGPYIQPLPLE